MYLAGMANTQIWIVSFTGQDTAGVGGLVGQRAGGPRGKAVTQPLRTRSRRVQERWKLRKPRRARRGVAGWGGLFVQERGSWRCFWPVLPGRGAGALVGRALLLCVRRGLGCPARAAS